MARGLFSKPLRQLKAFVLLLLLLPASAAAMPLPGRLDFKDGATLSRPVADDEAIPAAWLETRISVADAEAAHPGIVDERIERFPDLGKPFGGRHAQWEALKAAMQPDDEIWTFASPADSWRHFAGRAGVALVRAGQPILAVVTTMN